MSRDDETEMLERRRARTERFYSKTTTGNHFTQKESDFTHEKKFNKIFNKEKDLQCTEE